DLGDDEEHRHKNDRQRNHQRANRDQENGVAPAELVLAEREGRHTVNQQRQNRRGDRDDETVAQIRPERKAVNATNIVVETEADRLNWSTVVDVDANNLFRIRGVDHLRFQPDAAYLRQLT